MMICHLRTAAIGLGLLAALACQHSNQHQPQDPANSTAVATIDGQTITMGELDAFIKEILFDQSTSNRDPATLYSVRLRFLNDMLDERALHNAAAAEGLSPEAYVDQQLEAGGEVSEEQIAALYNQRIEQMGGRSLDEVRDRIAAYLLERRRATIVSNITKQADSKILLEPARIDVEAIGFSKGPDDALVTIVEFSDFQCPYCSRVVSTIDQILEKYPTQVRFVYRNLPLSIHPRAQALAEAAVCAGNQGKFWEYHDLIFMNAKADSDEDIERHATQLGLEMQAFRQCVQNRETQQTVEADMAAADGAGISGTPSFLVNGIPMHGAQSFDEFSRVIDDEIARNSADGSSATR